MFFAQLVQSEELPGEKHILFKATRRHFDSNDNLSVWHHHSDAPKHNFQVFWQLLPACITGIHRQENPEFNVHRHVVTIPKQFTRVTRVGSIKDRLHEHKYWFAFFSGLKDYIDLLGGYRKYRQLDAVKLVKTSPGA